MSLHNLLESSQDSPHKCENVPLHHPSVKPSRRGKLGEALYLTVLIKFTMNPV